MPNAFPGIVIAGDIQRRLATLYLPDFYKDRVSHDVATQLMKSAAGVLDYMRVMANGLPGIVNVETCPPDLLPLLGGLIGYKWKPTASVEGQRQEIRKLVEVYLIRGTPQSVIRILLNAGATVAEVFTPAEHIFTYDQSPWDQGDRYEDMDYWRWGVWEAAANIDFSAIHEDIEDVHPAGTVWFGRQYEMLGNENPGDPDTETPLGINVMHVYQNDYREPAGLAYDATVLEDDPQGYWKLEEDDSIIVPATESSAVYGAAIYGVSVYGGRIAMLATDSSGNGFHGTYNSETEVVAYGDAVRTVFPELMLAVKPALPHSLRLTYDDKLAVDDGAGHITGDAIGAIDYTNGKISNLVLAAPVGAGAVDLPITPGDPTFPGVPEMQLWIKADAITGYAVSASMPTFPEFGLHAATLTCPASHRPTYNPTPMNAVPTLTFLDATAVLPVEVDLGTNHLILCTFRVNSLNSLNTLLFGTGSKLDYSNTTSQFRYTVGGETVTFPARSILNENMLFAIQRIGATITAYLNGSVFGTATLTTGAAASFKIGFVSGEDVSSTRPFNANIGEVIAIGTSLGSDARRAAIRSVGKKYGLFSGVFAHVDPDVVTGLQAGDPVSQITDKLGNLFTVGPLYRNGTVMPTIEHWHKGDGIVQGGDTTVSVWPNAGSLGAITQGSDGLKPIFKANRLGGLGTLQFDGLNDEMNIFGAYGNTYTLGYLFRNDDTARSAILSGNPTGFGDNAVRYRAPVDGGAAIQMTVNGVTATWPFTFVQGRWYFIQIERATSVAKLYVDGVLVSAQTSHASSDGSMARIGHAGPLTTDYFKGEMAEIIVRSAALAADLTYNMADGIAQKWGYTVPRRVAEYQPSRFNGHAALRGRYNPSDNSGSALSLLTTRNLFYGSTMLTVFRTPDLNAYLLAGDTVTLAGGYANATSRIAYSPAGGGSLIYSTDTAMVSVPYKLESNRDYVLTIRRNRGVVQFYIDGILVGTATLTGHEDSVFVFSTILADSTAAVTAATHNFNSDFGYGVYCDVALEDDEMVTLHQHVATRFLLPYNQPTAFPLRAFYNDYVQRQLDGPVVGITSHAARFGLQQIIVNKGRIRIPNVAGLYPGSGSYTIEAPIRVPPSNGGTIFGMHWLESGVPRQLSLSIDPADGQAVFVVNNGFKTYTLKSGISVADQQWHWIQAVLDVTAHRLFLRCDFALVDADDYDIMAAMNPNYDFFIGALSDLLADPLHFHGDIGRVAVYNTAVPPQRLAAHYARGFGGMAVDDATIAMLVSNLEPLGSFGVRAFAVDESSLDSTDEIDGEDIVSVITGDTWRFALNPVGVGDKLGIRDRVQTDHMQMRDKLGIKDVVKFVIGKRVTVTDKLGVSDAPTAVHTP